MDVDDSIIMDDAAIEAERRLIRSMVGKGSEALSANGFLLKGERLVVRENMTLYL